MKCYIIDKEILEEECETIIRECYKEKNGRELPKRFKRIIGWKSICKQCKYHEIPED